MKDFIQTKHFNKTVKVIKGDFKDFNYGLVLYLKKEKSDQGNYRLSNYTFEFFKYNTVQCFCSIV